MLIVPPPADGMRLDWIISPDDRPGQHAGGPRALFNPDNELAKCRGRTSAVRRNRPSSFPFFSARKGSGHKFTNCAGWLFKNRTRWICRLRCCAARLPASWSSQILVVANLGRCKSWSLQILVVASLGLCKSCTTCRFPRGGLHLKLVRRPQMRCEQLLRNYLNQATRSKKRGRLSGFHLHSRRHGIAFGAGQPRQPGHLGRASDCVEHWLSQQW